MKYCDFNKCGIHTRLQNIIDKSGGYDMKLAAKQLMFDYQLNNYEIAYEMAKNENIRDEIESVGIEAIVKLTRKSIELNNRKVRNSLLQMNIMTSLLGGDKYGRI